MNRNYDFLKVVVCGFLIIQVNRMKWPVSQYAYVVLFLFINN